MTRLLGWALSAALATATSSAFAADLPPVPTPPLYKTPAAVAPPSLTWGGCYVGGNAGYGWAPEQWNYGYYDGIDYNYNYGSHRDSGGVGGGQIGCNYQTGSIVLGVEGQFDWAGLKGSHEDPYLDGYFQSTDMDWIATATGRIGYAWDRALLYVKGGAAWDRGSYNMMLSGISYSDTVTRTGWTAGGGVEYAFSPNWSVRIEYDYMGFGFHDVWWNYLYASPPNPWSFHVDQNVQTVTLGINFRLPVGGLGGN